MYNLKKKTDKNPLKTILVLFSISPLVYRAGKFSQTTAISIGVFSADGHCGLITHSQLTGTIDVVQFQPFFFVAHIGLHNIRRYGFVLSGYIEKCVKISGH